MHRKSEFNRENSKKLSFKAQDFLVYNKLPNNKEICTKKNLLKNMVVFYRKKQIDPFSKIPLTFDV